MKHLNIVPFLLSLFVSGSYLLTLQDLPLGSIYDSLMKFRPGIEAPRDLVVIDSKNVAAEGLSSEDAVRILVTLSAMESRLAVFQTNVLLPDESQAFSSPERQQLVEKEFSRIQKNILNLFDGIRLGSIRPQDAERYVTDLNGLVEESKHRLLLTIAESGNTRELELEKARALFNRLILCDDITWGASTGSALEVWGGEAVYSQVTRDADGTLRGIYPVRTLPHKELIHAGVALLLNIMGDATIERQGTMLTLQTEGQGYELPLDSRGRLLVQHPETYQIIPVEDFRAYWEQEKKLYETLKEMERSGYFIHLDALQYPTTLYEYAQSLEQEAMENPLPDTIRQWRNARAGFYQAANDFLLGPAEETILAGYDTLLATEELQEGGRERIASLKDLASQSFGWARKAYGELMALHQRLASLLRDAYCIIGSTTGDADATVSLLSTILSRSFIHPGRPLYLFFAIVAGLVLLYLATRIFSPLWFLIFAIIFAGIAFIVGAGLFVIGGYWYAPQVPVVILLCTAILFELVQVAHILYIRRHQELALKPRMSPAAFRELVRGIPFKKVPSVSSPADIQEAEALILCARYPSFPGDGTESSLKAFARDLKTFRQRAAEQIRNCGGTLLWTDGEVLFAAFGFPVLHAGAESGISTGALAAVEALIRAFPDGSVTMGMDYGYSAFYFDVISGYSAIGRVPVHARVLSGLANRYHTRFLCTDTALNQLQQGSGKTMDATFVGSLVDKQEQRELRFFTIPGTAHSGS